MPRVSIFTERRRLRSVLTEQLNGELDEAILVIAPMLAPLALAKHICLPPTLNVATIELEHGPCTIAYQGLNLRRKPQGGSPGSAALYLLELSIGSTLVLLQLLPKDSETSTHFHLRERERFYPVAGSCVLHRGPVIEDLGLARKEETLSLAVWRDHHVAKAVIPPRVAHQLQTRKTEGALNLIVIGPTEARRREELKHRPVRWVS